MWRSYVAASILMIGASGSQGPITRTVRRVVGRTQAPTTTAGLPLTKLGARLCKKLERLQMHVISHSAEGHGETGQVPLDCGA